MTTTYRATPPANYPDPTQAYSYAIDTTGGIGWGGGYSDYGGGYGSGYGGGFGGWGLGSGLAAGYPKGGADKRTPALMGFGGLQFIPDGGVSLSWAIDDVIQRLGPGVYDQIAQDDCAGACLSLLVYAIIGGEIHVEPAIVAEPGERVDDTTDPKRLKDIEDAKRYADECKLSLNRVPDFLDELEALVRLGAIRGSALCDPAWEVIDAPSDGKPITVLKSIQCKSSYTWAMVVDKYGQLDGVVGYSWEGPKRYDRDRFLIYVNGRSNGDPRGTSDLRGAYDPWNFKVQARPERGKYIATFANPTVLVEYDGNVPPAYPLNPDGTEDMSGGPLMPQAQAERIGANLHGASYAAVPAGWKVTLVQSASDGGAFSRHEEECNKAISMAILLNPRTNNEAAHGSKADSDSSVSTTMMKVSRRQMTLTRAIEQSIFKVQTLMNHGEEAASRLCPKARFPEPDAQDLAARLTAWVAAGYKAVPRQYAKLDSEFGVPIRTADEIDELQKQADAAQQATVDAMKAKAMGPMGGPGQGKPDDGKPDDGGDGKAGASAGKRGPSAASPKNDTKSGDSAQFAGKSGGKPGGAGGSKPKVGVD